MNLFELILLGIYQTSWVCRLIVSIKFRNFLAIMSSNIPSTPFSLYSPSGSSIMHEMVCLMLSHRFPRCSSFLFILFSFCSSDEIISIHIFNSCLQAYWFFCPLTSTVESQSTVEFLSFIIHFNFRIYICFFIYIYIYLLIFSIFSYLVRHYHNVL